MVVALIKLPTPLIGGMYWILCSLIRIDYSTFSPNNNIDKIILPSMKDN